MTRDIYDRLKGGQFAEISRNRDKLKNYKDTPVDRSYADKNQYDEINHIGYATIPPWGIVDVFEFTDGVTKRKEECIIMHLDSFSALGKDLIHYLSFPDKEEK